MALRIDEGYLDIEIQDLIDSCLADLRLSGVKKLDVTDPLIIQSVKTYARAYFDVTNQDHEKLVRSYESLKAHLTLTEEYTVVIAQ